MDTLKNIFDNAAKQTTNNTYGWGIFEENDPNPEDSTIESPAEKARRKIKTALKEATQDPYKAAMDYQKTVEYFLAQRAKLPGRVETGGMISPRAPSQISSMPGATRGLRAESFTDKIAEVRARMRAFATDKYYSDITYGK
jgi:hypothetical protein